MALCTLKLPWHQLLGNALLHIWMLIYSHLSLAYFFRNAFKCFQCWDDIPLDLLSNLFHVLQSIEVTPINTFFKSCWHWTNILKLRQLILFQAAWKIEGPALCTFEISLKDTLLPSRQFDSIYFSLFFQKCFLMFLYLWQRESGIFQFASTEEQSLWHHINRLCLRRLKIFQHI
jgi:hypothetical protein